MRINARLKQFRSESVENVLQANNRSLAVQGKELVKLTSLYDTGMVTGKSSSLIEKR